MRLVFAGTPEFAERSLAALLAAGHEPALVLTQPDRPAGRGQRPAPGAVKRLAISRRLPVLQPETLREKGEADARIASASAELLVVVAYGLIIPKRVLDAFPRGAVNVHASLLPRWRGAAPIQRALMAGDPETGVSIMQLDEGLDTGPVLAQQRIPIAADDDSATLHDKLAAMGARLLPATIAEMAAGCARAVRQPTEGATYARKIDKTDAQLDWRRPAIELERGIRALRPAPTARARLREHGLKIWRARLAEGAGAPGAVLGADEQGLRVACGAGALLVTELQREGGRRLAAGAFLRGFPVAAGERFAC
jgi:methionyl-tRNA formyltransferase